MALDTDIAAAADLLTLEKIKTQEHRNDVANLAAHRAATQAGQAALRQQVVAFMEWVKAEQLRAPDVAGEFRRGLALAIAVNYMKPTTGTLPETIAADALTDAARLKAAVDAASAAI